MNIIEAKNLTKYYGQTKGVENLNLQISAGEIFGFLGPNGAGKTTTIKTILNFYRADKGEVLVFGKDNRKNYVEILGEIGYLPGDVQLFDRLSGQKMISLTKKFYDQRNHDHYTEELINRLQCEVNVPYKKLSKGNKQKIGVLLALFHQPKLLILDEPTAGLDPISQNEFYRVLKEINKKGTTIFFSSHNLYEVEKICDRVGIIRDGGLVAVETIEELRRRRRKKVEIVFADSFNKEEFAAISGIEIISANEKNLQLYVEANSMDNLLEKLARQKVLDVTAYYPDLEEIFLQFYREGK